jgi:hypothetical protein
MVISNVIISPIYSEKSASPADGARIFPSFFVGAWRFQLTRTSLTLTRTLNHVCTRLLLGPLRTRLAYTVTHLREWPEPVLQISVTSIIEHILTNSEMNDSEVDHAKSDH